ncbi:MAG TPA: hypothetical protein VL383_11065 [Gemmatimonadaceae bacterium]|nr:hypothetical protein [Gemmatimonadaceae bacterium]
MTALSRLRVVRGVLVTGVVVRAIAWGVAAGLSLLIGAAIVDSRFPLQLGTRHLLVALAVAAQLAVTIALLWRDRAAAMLDRVALWIEERHPSLAYTLVTAVEMRDERLVQSADTRPWPGTAVQRAARALALPLGIVVLAVAALVLLPPGAVARVRSPHPGDALSASRTKDGGRNRLSPLVARVRPPAYAHLSETAMDEPTDIRALAGSRIVLRGRGAATGIAAVRDLDTARASQSGDEWTIEFSVGVKAEAMRLLDRRFERIVAIEPIADAAPTVTLDAPAHDSVLRVARGQIPLAATAHDDFAVASARFEYIVSSGEGENFTFKSGMLGAVRPNAASVSLMATLSLDALALKPGDIVHVRAVARDANDVSGPGIGSSETRAFRVARSGEYDTLAVDAAPPSDEDKSLISERMLITLAEALEKRRQVLKRDSIVTESRAIAVDQKRLRRTVGDIVFMRIGGQPSGEETTDEAAPARARTMEEMLARADSATNRSVEPIDFAGGESPVVAVNKPLLEAYNAMWDAGTELEVGEPGRALPHMRRALAAIQRARQAERIYLRGRPPQVVVDIAKARLQGKDKGASSNRRPATVSDSTFQARVDRFVRAVELTARDARAAVDSLLILRIEALGESPQFAAALGDATDALRRGRSADATSVLGRARRALAGPSTVRDSIARWGILP